MDVAGEPFPGFMHQGATLIEETATVPIDDDSIRVNQNNRRGALAASIDRFGVHSVPVAGACSPKFDRHTNAVATVEKGSWRNQLHPFCPGAEMLAHHLTIGLETAASENDRVRRQNFFCVISRNFETGNLSVFGQK
jgi:hypothetical protein